MKVKARGQRDLVTVVGSLASVNAGEWLTAEGHWIQDRQFGLQFRADLLRSTPPTSREGIEKYLASGMVKGIGPTYAGKLVEKFGEKIFDIIDNCSGRLEEVEGIGPERRRRIKAAWAEQKVIREIMVFLHSNGVGTSRAVRIYKTYGDEAVELIQANPYILAARRARNRISDGRPDCPEDGDSSRFNHARLRRIETRVTGSNRPRSLRLAGQAA